MTGRYEAIELKLLRAFATLAEELNFGRAAERLHITQPALSAQIRQLEQRLGLALFIRSTRRVGLTAEGTALLGPARSLLEESTRFSETVEQVRGRPERRLIFGAALYTLGIPERQQLVDGFIERYPNIRFTVSSLWQREIARALMRGEADLALMLGVPVSLAQWEAEPTADVIFPDVLPRIVLREERIGLLVPRASPLSVYDPIPPELLAGENVAMLGGAHGSAILEPVRSVLRPAGAALIVPPEPHAVGVEHYGRQFHIPAISLGWFDTAENDPQMVRRYIDGLELKTQFAVVRAPNSTKAAANLLWEEVRDRFPDAEMVGV